MIVLALLASLTAPPTRSTPPPGTVNASVGVIGDSLTVASATPLTSALSARGIDVQISAQTGRSIPGGITALTALRESGFDSLVWVVALGTNDIWWNPSCGCGITPSAASNLIQRMLDAIGPGRYVYWVNVHRTDVPVAVAVFNQALAQAAVNRPNLRIVDWYGLSSANLGWFAGDGIHLSSTGYTRRAEQIAVAVAANPVALATRGLPSQLGPTDTERPSDALAVRGDRGDVVRTVQQALLDRGFAVSGGADGIFGAGTEQAVRSFQESIGLRPTGIVTAKTAAALGVTP
jgi:lysophospholipase L1-like esterase